VEFQIIPGILGTFSGILVLFVRFAISSAFQAFMLAFFSTYLGTRGNVSEN